MLQVPLKPAGGTMQFRLFTGPLATHVLNKVDAIYGGDYLDSQSYHGWFTFISIPFAKFLFLS